MDATAQENRKSTYDRPEKGSHCTTHLDNAPDQISNHSNIHKPKILDENFTAWKSNQCHTEVNLNVPIA